MGGSPTVVRQDPEGDAKKAADKAVVEANQKKAQRRTASALGSGGTATIDQNLNTKLGGG